MSTLADELLQDFGDSGSEDGDDQVENGLLDTDAASNGWRPDGAAIEIKDADAEDDEDEMMEDMDGEALNVTDDPEETKARVEKMQLGGVQDVRSVAGLMKTLKPVLEVSDPFHPSHGTPVRHEKAFTSLSTSISPDLLRRTLQKIAHFQSMSAESGSIGNIEDHPEYHLLTQANSLSTSIDSDIVVAHKFIRDHYSIRFPELETLISNPVEYAKTVAILGNGPLDSDSIKELQISANNPLGVSLKATLDGPTLMIVTVEATTSKGQAMSQEELARVTEACEMVLSLDRAKKILTEYVQSRMNLFAPNLTALIGSLTAAQLLNAAGGLAALAKTPACNLPAWGSKKQASAALATNIGIRQQGFIYHAPEVRSVPTDLKRQAMRMFANKIVLCARTDCTHTYADGSEGERLKNDVLDRLDKLQAKPLNKGARALPAPDDKPSRKRGGRRARKAKEATAMTDLRKQKNRMAFGREEQEVGYGNGDETEGMGMIGQRDDGRLRATQVDQRTRAKLSAKSKGWGGATSLTSGSASSLRGLAGAGAGISLPGRTGLRTSGVGSSINAAAGTVSSLAFTPMQGLELVDPKVQAELTRKRKADEDRWFKGGTFTQLGGSGASGSSDGVFKKPALPPAKRVDTGATKSKN